MTTDVTPTTGLSTTDIQLRIDESVAHTATADAKAGALLTIAGLLAAAFTALAGWLGISRPEWLVNAGLVAAIPVVAALVLLLIALRPRLPIGPDATSFAALGRRTADNLSDLARPVEPQGLAIRLNLVARIALRKYQLITAAVDCLIGAVLGAAAVTAAALLI